MISIQISSIILFLFYILTAKSYVNDFKSLHDHLSAERIEDLLERPKFSSYGSSFIDRKDPSLPDSMFSDHIDNMVTKTGTTIVGFCCADGVVLGADTRTTGGAMIVNKIKRKIHEISSHIYCCTAGTVADCDGMVRQARYDLMQKRIRDANLLVHEKESKYASIRSVLASLRRSMTKPRGGRSPQAVFVVGGYDEKGYALHSVGDNAVTNRIPYGALGSGSMKATATMEAEIFSLNNASEDFLDGVVANVSLSQAVDIVRKAVLSGIQNDLGSGNHLDIVTITRDEVEMWREELSYDQGLMKITRLSMMQDDSMSNNQKLTTASDDIESSSLGRVLSLRSDDSITDIDVEMVYEEI
jgi:20S proteasome alpha/beta subunit